MFPALLHFNLMIHTNSKKKKIAFNKNDSMFRVKRPCK